MISEGVEKAFSNNPITFCMFISLLAQRSGNKKCLKELKKVFS